MLARLLLDRVGHMALGDQGQRLDPFQRCAFPLGEDGSFTLGIQQMHSLIILAVLAGLRSVHHEAIGAALICEARTLTSSRSERSSPL
jgi:hypothetical protein